MKKTRTTYSTPFIVVKSMGPIKPKKVRSAKKRKAAERATKKKEKK